MKTHCPLFLSCLFCVALLLVSGCGKETNTAEPERDVLTHVAKNNEDKTSLDESNTGEKPAILQDEVAEFSGEVKVESPTLPVPHSHFPDHYRPTFSLFEEAISNGNEAEADRIAQECITLAETRNEPLNLILTLHLVLGKGFLSVEMYDSAHRYLTEVAKQCRGIYVHPLAFCMALSGDADGGFTLLMDEINRNSSVMDVLLPAILVFLEHERINLPSETMFEKIDDLMNRVETEKPVDPRTIFALANYWLVRGKQERAISLYEEALIRDDLNDPLAWVFRNNLAMLYSDVLGQHTKALEVVDKALETNRDNFTLLYTKGTIYLNAGEPALSIPVLQRAVELSCQLPIHCLCLAYALHLDGRDDESRRYFDVFRDAIVPARLLENNAMFDALMAAHP